MQWILRIFGKSFYPYFIYLKCSLFNNHLRKFKCSSLVINKINYLKIIVKRIRTKCRIIKMKFKNFIIIKINRQIKFRI